MLSRSLFVRSCFASRLPLLTRPTSLAPHSRITSFNHFARTVTTSIPTPPPPPASAAQVPPPPTSDESEHSVPKSVRWWLYSCAGLVFGIVVVGGTTRLTNSGLSMVEWKPTTVMPPMNQKEWEEEFEKYKQFPEYQKLNLSMQLPEFKKIFFWEYFHRLLGRAIGVWFALPFAYFASRRVLPSPLVKKLWIMLGMGASQGALGWYMVKSGLDAKQTITPYPTVSPYRLAAHLSSAFVIFSFILWTALSLSYPQRMQTFSKELLRFRSLSSASTALLCGTITSGAFVAGLDAGLVYNELPFMGEGLVPAEWADLKPFWKNLTENPAFVQFNHRVMATTTFLSILTTFHYGIRAQLPHRVRILSLAMMGIASVQVTLGILTLLFYVPVPLGVMHQAGSLSLLTVMIALMHSLRMPLGGVVGVAKKLM